ncbi:MAG: radical SAM protein [Candidatus Omnitrophica bacterium]|nr:radical SAM protein [Candidatus Omnitrophota bacterium]
MLPWFKKRDEYLDLVLVMCPGWGVIQAPAAIGYLKGFLEANNITCRCFDINIKSYKMFDEKKYWELNYPDHFVLPHMFERDIQKFLAPFIDIWARRILEFKPRAVGLSLYMSSINASVALARSLKKMEPQIVIIGGGPEVDRIKRVALDGIRPISPANRDIFDTFDVLVSGEGEETLLELMSKIKKGEDFSTTTGIVLKRDEQIIANSPRELMKDLDLIPEPDYTDLDLADYTGKALPVVTSRGCINRCTFCADSPLWKRYRCLSPEKTVKDMRNLAKRYSASSFEIVDSIFNGDIERLEKICDLIIDSGIRMQWSAKAMLRREMDYRLLSKMKKAGCCALAYGVESGSPGVLKDMRKSTDLGAIRRIIKDTHSAGIEPNCFFIIGYPTETEEDFKQTLRFIEEMGEFIHRFDQVTSCHIEEGSFLGLNTETYGITFDDQGHWYSKESTPEIRQERMGRFRDLARKLHTHYECEVQA